MNKHIAAEYERKRKIFMKQYGTVHACGECIYTTACKRMKIQNSKFNKEKKNNLMKELAPFVTNFEIETYNPRNQKTPINFIKVYTCDNFVYDGGR